MDAVRYEKFLAELRALAKEAKDDDVNMPDCTFKESVGKELDEVHTFIPVNLGKLLTLVADMAE